jgi:hypothetical protein
LGYVLLKLLPPCEKLLYVITLPAQLVQQLLIRIVLLVLEVLQRQLRGTTSVFQIRVVAAGLVVRSGTFASRRAVVSGGTPTRTLITGAPVRRRIGRWTIRFVPPTGVSRLLIRSRLAAARILWFTFRLGLTLVGILAGFTGLSVLAGLTRLAALAGFARITRRAGLSLATVRLRSLRLRSLRLRSVRLGCL